ncbi:MAG: EVE domain-containing protein [Verrucomicrobiota bacterium]
MNYWLMKSEPDVFSLQDLARVGQEPWDGIRNYQARNFMRDEMKPGDLALFYHSNTKPPGVAGVARIASTAYPDATQFDPASPYFDLKSKREAPRWILVDVAFVAEFPHYLPLEEMKEDPALEDLLILRKGNRLSITPVEAKDFQRVCRLGGLKKLPK